MHHKTFYHVCLQRTFQFLINSKFTSHRAFIMLFEIVLHRYSSYKMKLFLIDPKLTNVSKTLFSQSFCFKISKRPVIYERECTNVRGIAYKLPSCLPQSASNNGHRRQRYKPPSLLYSARDARLLHRSEKLSLIYTGLK